MYFSEIRCKNNVDVITAQITACNRQRLNGLVDRTGTDGLHLGVMMFPNDPGNRPRDGCGSELGGHLDYIRPQ